MLLKDLADWKEDHTNDSEAHINPEDQNKAKTQDNMAMRHHDAIPDWEKHGLI